MEKGHSLLYCPPCTLVNNQKEQFEQLQRNANVGNAGSTSSSSYGSTTTWDESLGSIIGLLLVPSLLTYWISDMGFWESVVAVLWFPVAVVMFFLAVFGGI